MLRRILDLWLAPKTFTAAMMLFPLYALLAIYALAHAGAWALLSWGAILLGWWLEAALTVCRRCKHYGTWHCAGQGMLVSKIFARRAPGLPRWRVVAHFVTDAVAFFFPMPFIWAQPGPWGVFASLGYLVFMGVASVPRKGPSYTKPRFEA